MKSAIDITKQEIKWHKENRGIGPSPKWEEGFIKGLEHLLYLFEQADTLEAKKRCHVCSNLGYTARFCHNCGTEVNPPDFKEPADLPVCGKCGYDHFDHECIE